MLRVVRSSEMDRPTKNSLIYLKRVAPHMIRKDPRLKDAFVHECLSELMESNVIEEFGEYTRSFYTLEGHYSNLWMYDIPIVPMSRDPVLTQASPRPLELLSLIRRYQQSPGTI